MKLTPAVIIFTSLANGSPTSLGLTPLQMATVFVGITTSAAVAYAKVTRAHELFHGCVLVVLGLGVPIVVSVMQDRVVRLVADDEQGH